MNPGLVSRLLGPGNERVHAAVILLTTVTLCSCTLVLAGAASGGKQVDVTFASAVGAVSALAGWAYGKAKQVEAAASSAPNGEPTSTGAGTPTPGESVDGGIL